MKFSLRTAWPGEALAMAAVFSPSLRLLKFLLCSVPWKKAAGSLQTLS